MRPKQATANYQRIDAAKLRRPLPLELDFSEVGTRTPCCQQHSVSPEVVCAQRGVHVYESLCQEPIAPL